MYLIRVCSLDVQNLLSKFFCLGSEKFYDSCDLYFLSWFVYHAGWVSVLPMVKENTLGHCFVFVCLVIYICDETDFCFPKVSNIQFLFLLVSY